MIFIFFTFFNLSSKGDILANCSSNQGLILTSKSKGQTSSSKTTSHQIYQIQVTC